MKTTSLDRIFLLITGVLASYQIAVGIDGLPTLPTVAYTVAFGALLVAVLLLIILGFDVLASPAVVIVSTVIPLSLSLGLVWESLPGYRTPYVVFAVVGFLAVLVTRLFPVLDRFPVVVLALVHAVAGLTIFGLPIWLAVQRSPPAGFGLVGVGGALIGLGGLFLSFLKAGRPILSRETILRVLPVLLLLMNAAFVGGFAFV